MPTVMRAGDAKLCSDSAPDDLEIVSGNHRSQAAIAAGLEEIEVLEIVTPLSREQKVALQLSHNAISGKDDPAVLWQLYNALDLDQKLYSGLTDDWFKGLPEIDVTALGIGAVKYEELLITFLPAELEQFADCLKRIEASKRQRAHLLADAADFDRFFDAVIAVKNKRNIYNSAMALRTMAALACERLDQLEADDGGEA